MARGIDTDPHPRFPVYSAGNFAEVAPLRLSVASWSLLGPPMERGTRALVDRLMPGTSWHRGSRFVFVGYFACRPFHNLSSACQMAREVPWLEPGTVTDAYFEGHRVPPGPVSKRHPWEQWVTPTLMARELARIVARAPALEERMAMTEGRLDRAIDRGDPVDLAGALSSARALVDDCWELHIATTTALVPLFALQRGAGRRLVRHWADVEPWLNRPDELVWDRLGDLDRMGAAPLSTDFLTSPLYEIADAHEPWVQIVPARSTHIGSPPDDVGELAGIALDMLPRPSRWVMRSLVHLVSEGMYYREHSKSLAMRGLHLFRRGLPLVAGHRLARMEPDDWSYLTADELVDTLPREPDRVIGRRRAECAAASTVELPDYLDFGVGAVAVASLLAGQATATEGLVADEPGRERGVAPGWATGVAHRWSGDIDELPDEDSIVLVVESADADLQPILPLLAGIVSHRGSQFSHIAILAREWGIPAVVGHALALTLTDGQHVSLDGSSGKVDIID
jgi:phosphohistidine swiveling domain-containing protein